VHPAVLAGLAPPAHVQNSISKLGSGHAMPYNFCRLACPHVKAKQYHATVVLKARLDA
jgi:hypothetical protein